MTTTCDLCQREYGIGDSPYCKDGHQPWRGATHPDDIPGGMVVENGFDQPTRFYSHSAHRAALAKNGYEIRAKWAGPGDKHMTNWAAGISAHHLESARILLERGMQARQEAKARLNAALMEFPISVRTMDPNEVGR